MLKAGFARLDITPPLGTFLSGSYNARYAKGVLDPLELNAIAFSDGETTDLLITADLIGVDRVTCNSLREEISSATGVNNVATPTLLTFTGRVLTSSTVKR